MAPSLAVRGPRVLLLALVIASLSCVLLATTREATRLSPTADATPTEIDPIVRSPELSVVRIPPAWERGTCALPFVRQLRRHPEWMVRIDDNNRRHCGLSPEVRNASIELTETGAIWRADGRLRYERDQTFAGTRIPQQLALDAGELVRLSIALEAMCLPSGDETIRESWYSLALDRTSDPVSSFIEGSVGEQLIDQLFADLQARYNAERAHLANNLVVDLDRTPYQYVGWIDFRLWVRSREIRIISRTVDQLGRTSSPETYRMERKSSLSTEDTILLADCLAALPYETGVPPALTGSAQIDGVELPIRIGARTLADSVCLRVLGIPTYGEETRD